MNIMIIKICMMMFCADDDDDYNDSNGDYYNDDADIRLKKIRVVWRKAFPMPFASGTPFSSLIEYCEWRVSIH